MLQSICYIIGVFLSGDWVLILDHVRQSCAHLLLTESERQGGGSFISNKQTATGIIEHVR